MLHPEGAQPAFFPTDSPSRRINVRERHFGHFTSLSATSTWNSFPHTAHRKTRSPVCDMAFTPFGKHYTPTGYQTFPIVATITAFIVWSLFSASSKTFDCFDSKTSSVTSLPFTAGRQCKKIVSSRPVAPISFASTR